MGLFGKVFYFAFVKSGRIVAGQQSMWERKSPKRKITAMDESSLLSLSTTELGLC